MTVHIFADRGLMLAETAGIDWRSMPDVRYTAYSQQRRPGRSARIWQTLHILLRPVSLRWSARCARLFNRHLEVDPVQLNGALAAIKADDQVLWLNPTLALAPVIERLRLQPVGLSIYFLDPIHRLGLEARTVGDWASAGKVASYWPQEAAILGMRFLAPYAPTPSPSLSTTAARDLDIVYVGSPTPRRLLWILMLQCHLRLRGRRGHLRLASRNAWLARWMPRVFAPRMAFDAYMRLCARSRGVLELHERDAGGVTLRATLCEALACTHLCNEPTTQQTVSVSLWKWSALDKFLRSTEVKPPQLRAPPFEDWLRAHFV